MLIVLGTIISYGPIYKADFIWDDDAYVTQNESIRSIEGIGRAWTSLTETPQYYPLVFTTFWIEYSLFGINPLVFHATNVLIHCASALLLWRLFSKLAVPGAWFAALLFALHPVHVESVAWVTERKNTLSMFFYLLAALAYVRFSGLGASRGEEHKRQWGWYAACLMCFQLAMFSKTVTCSLPAALALVTWWKRPRLQWRDYFPLVPMLLMGFTMSRITIWVEQHHVLAKELNLGLTAIDRVLLAGKSLWLYASNLLYPRTLCFMYERWEPDRTDPAQYVWPIGVVVAIVALWLLRNRIGKGPLVATLVFCGTLVPALCLVDVYPMRYTWWADHYVYHASIGFFALLSGVAVRLSAPAAGSRHGVRITPSLAVAAVAVAGLLGSRTWQQCRIYDDIETLWLDTIAKNPKCWMAKTNLSVEWFNKGRMEDAKAILHEVMNEKPHYQAYNNLGGVYLKMGEYADAIDCFRRAVEGSPNYCVVYHNLGMALRYAGRDAEALEVFRRAIELEPGFGLGQHSYGESLIKAKRFGEAREHLMLALDKLPRFADLRVTLGDLEQVEGNYAAAEEQYKTAIRLQPNQVHAHCRLAMMKAARGAIEEAFAIVREYLARVPGSAEALRTFGELFRMRGDMDNAERAMRNAVAINARSLSAHLSLAGLLEARGRHDEAADQYSEVLRLSPGHPGANEALRRIRGRGASP